jgi:hypothetical protein
MEHSEGEESTNNGTTFLLLRKGDCGSLLTRPNLGHLEAEPWWSHEVHRVLRRGEVGFDVADTVGGMYFTKAFGLGCELIVNRCLSLDMGEITLVVEVGITSMLDVVKIQMGAINE